MSQFFGYAFIILQPVAVFVCFMEVFGRVVADQLNVCG